MRHPSVVLATVTMWLLLPAVAGGQDVRLGSAGQSTLRGVVTDTGGFALDAELSIISLRRTATADANGRFTFGDLKPGRYQVSARRIGFYPQVKAVTVGDSDAVVSFALLPLVRTLAPVVTAAPRGGLSGVIGDTAFNVIAGAKIQIIASSRRDVSDSTGQFYIATPPGKQMVRVQKEGYRPRLVSVSVPSDSGRRILVWLSQSTAKANRREEVDIEAMRNRLMRRNIVYSALVTREDINQWGAKELREVATRAAGRYVDDMECMALIAGTGNSVPVWALSAAELEAVEVYWDNSKRARYTIGGNTARTMPSIKQIGTPPSSLKGGTCPLIYAWLRK